MLAHLAETIPAELQLGVVETVIAKGIDGLDLQGAAMSNMRVEQFRAGIEGASNAFQPQADSWVNEQGFQDHQAFYGYIRSEHPEEAAAAMRTFVASRNPKAFTELLQTYRRSVMPSTESLVKEGYVRTERDGSCLVRSTHSGPVSPQQRSSASSSHDTQHSNSGGRTHGSRSTSHQLKESP
jgi:hypothetical protein